MVPKQGRNQTTLDRRLPRKALPRNALPFPPGMARLMPLGRASFTPIPLKEGTMAKKASSRKLSDLSIKRRPEAEDVKGGKTKFTLGSQATLKTASARVSARASARRSRPD